MAFIFWQVRMISRRSSRCCIVALPRVCVAGAGCGNREVLSTGARARCGLARAAAGVLEGAGSRQIEPGKQPWPRRPLTRARSSIIAEFEVKPGALEQFLELAKADAAQSVAKEPGCRQFDVTLEREAANRVVLYEIYDDEAAFDAHLQTAHLKAFRDGIEPLVLSRKARRLTRVHG